MNFYELVNNYDYPNILWNNEVMNFEGIKCPVYDGHQRPGGRMSDLRVILRSHRVADVMWTVYSECLITDRVARIFNKEKLTGYELLPVEVSGIKGKKKSSAEIPRFWELQLRGWGGMAKSESGIKLLESCPYCGVTKYRGICNPAELIDISQWDGSDFFMVWPLPRFVFVTEKVKQLVEKKRLSGCTLLPVKDLSHKSECDESNTLMPGRLRRWMPEKRARELGEPLGIY